MKKLIAGLAGVVMLVGTATTASAHDVASASADCAGITASFTSFPNAKNDVTVKAVTSKATSFTGSSGSVHVSWADVGDSSSKAGAHPYTISWTADGGGSQSFSYTSNGCAPAAPSTTTTSTTAVVATTTTTVASTTTSTVRTSVLASEERAPTTTAAVAPAHQLPNTGFPTALAALLALVALIIGTTALMASRRRP